MTGMSQPLCSRPTSELTTSSFVPQATRGTVMAWVHHMTAFASLQVLGPQVHCLLLIDCDFMSCAAGNPEPVTAWVNQMAAFIKTVDPNHMVRAC